VTRDEREEDGRERGRVAWPCRRPPRCSPEVRQPALAAAEAAGATCEEVEARGGEPPESPVTDDAGAWEKIFINTCFIKREN
jgi:hypothetical protein